MVVIRCRSHVAAGGLEGGISSRAGDSLVTMRGNKLRGHPPVLPAVLSRKHWVHHVWALYVKVMRNQLGAK